jgi:hypothetical protein
MKTNSPPVISQYTIQQIVALSLPLEEIKRRTSTIHAAAIGKAENISCANFNKIGDIDIRYIFRLYDRFFFGDFFTANYRGQLSFYLSGRMTRAAGKFVWRKRSQTQTFEIGIATAMLFDNFTTPQDTKDLSGFLCTNRLEALQRVIEHEIVHFLEYLGFGETDCSKERFKTICKAIFGHTKSVHALDTPRKIAANKYDLRVGSSVFFFMEGHKYEGRIQRIGRRATVIATKKDGVDISRIKCYAPFHMLKRPVPEKIRE